MSNDPKKVTEAHVRNKMDKYLAGLQDDHPGIRAVRLEFADMRQRIATLESGPDHQTMQRLLDEREHADKTLSLIMNETSFAKIGWLIEEHQKFVENLSD